VAIDPEALEKVVEETIASVAAELNVEAAISAMQRFRPGRPVPTHRIG